MSVTSEPPADGDRPWPAPGPDTGWWHGMAMESVTMPWLADPVVRSRRANGPRHRERRALPGAPVEAPTVRADSVPADSVPADSVPAGPAPVSPAPPEPPIWEPTGTEDGREWPARTLRAMRPGRLPALLGRQPRPAARPGRQVRRRRNTRRPGTGLVALVLFGLLAAFFAWFSAEPLWLSLGHGTPGTATVVSCPVHGIAKRCADFTADGGAFVADRVTLLGGAGVHVGATVPARMVSPTSSAAYVGETTSRWLPSLLAVLLCGLAIAWLTGVFRLAERRSRWTAFGLSLTAPLLLTLGMLIAAW